MSRRSAVAAMAAALALLAPAGALAADTQESMLQDDDQLVYSSPRHAEQVLEQLVTLGVDRIRVTIVWAALAPRPLSLQRPRFDATNPAAYPPGAWNRYDTLVRVAQSLGLGVDFNVSSPAPYWAESAPAPASGFRNTYSPSSAAFGDFVQAVGRRYSGTYVPSGQGDASQSEGVTVPSPPNVPSPPSVPSPPAAPGVPSPSDVPPLPVVANGSTPTPDAAALPRVGYWSIWNEPDQGGWLTPQWRKLRGGKFVPAAPAIYRRLVDAGWRSLMRTGHRGDTILIGETAANGFTGHGVGFSMRPMPFLKALYCVGDSFVLLSGPTAAAVACPTKPDPAAFVAAHPGLFDASGYAHHPYSFHAAPDVHLSDPNTISLADLPRLEWVLDRIFAAYGRLTGSGIPIYLTEYGYKSRPPNPFADFTARQQAAFINEGEYMGFLDPRVRAFSQFLLVDARPKAGAAAGSHSYWSTFQTGLIGFDGKRKPAYPAYQIPIWLPVARHGPSVTVWGQLRIAARDMPQEATLEFQPAGGQSFSELRVLRTANARGFILAHVPITSPGSVRLAWRDPISGLVYRSRTVRVL